MRAEGADCGQKGIKKLMKKNCLLILILGIFVACKDDPKTCWDPANIECENYDPCYGESEVTAGFVMEQQYGLGSELRDMFIEDSIFPNSWIRFRALEEGAYYKWYLGVEVIEGEDKREVVRHIGSLPPLNYPASLVVEKEPNKDCFPDDDGRDSVFHSFRKADHCNLLINNRFRGTFSHKPAEITEIEFLFMDTQGETPCGGISIYGINLRNSGDTLYTSADGYTNTRIKWIAVGANLNGEVVVDPSDSTVSAQYSWHDVKYNFSGKVIK